jgi:hypothetical protein
MRFRITKHTAKTPPDHVLELLTERIPQRREDVLFTSAGGEIRARLDRDDAVWMTQDERLEIGRRAVLDVVGEVCDRAPELKLDWYAVSPAR